MMKKMIGRGREVGSGDVWVGFAEVKREDGYLINIYKVMGKGEYGLSLFFSQFIILIFFKDNSFYTLFYFFKDDYVLMFVDILMKNL